MMESSLKTLVKALKEHDNEYLEEIKRLQNKIDGYEKERNLIIKALKEDKISNLKWYFGIK